MTVTEGGDGHNRFYVAWAIYGLAMQCQDCGTAVDDDADYCTECGAAIDGTATVADGGSATADAAAESGDADEHEIIAEVQGFYDTDELSTTLKVANRGSLFVTDQELVCGFDEVYERSAVDGAPLVGLFKAIFGGRYSGGSLEEALEHPDSVRIPLEDIEEVSVEKSARMPLAARDVNVYYDGGRVAMRVGKTVQKSGKTGPAKEFANEIEEAAQAAGAEL